MIVKDLMVPIVTFVHGHELFSQAVVKMRTHKLSSILVLDDDSLICGIVTERDVVRVFAERVSRIDSGNYLVRDVMTPDPMCVSFDFSLYDAVMLARTLKIRHIPVLGDDLVPVGIITQTASMEAFIQTIAREEELKVVNRKLESLALEDSMLGTGNRRALEIDLAATVSSCERYKNIFTVAMIDIDHFKSYNDCYGHLNGDEALKAVVQTIVNSKREIDRLYRYGGEEFLLLMPNTAIADGAIGSERIRDSVESAQLLHERAPSGYLTISIGLAQWNRGESWQEVVKCADQNLYKGKAMGRNRVVD